jgi:hypothetical protein
MKTIFTSILLLISAASFAADEGIHEKFKGDTGVFALSLSKTMLDAIDLDLKWNDELKYVNGDLNRIEFLAFSEEIQKRQSELLKDLNGKHYEEFDLEDEDEDLRVFVVRKGKNITQVHFLKTSEQKDEGVCLLSVYGDIQVSNQKDKE